jgi:hypothetical protein
LIISLNCLSLVTRNTFMMPVHPTNSIMVTRQPCRKARCRIIG